MKNHSKGEKEKISLVASLLGSVETPASKKEERDLDPSLPWGKNKHRSLRKGPWKKEKRKNGL